MTVSNNPVRNRRITSGCGAVVMALFFACSSNERGPGISVNPEQHTIEIDAWQADRIANLKSENGWLNLAGLFWLKEGINTFGSGNGNDIVFPEGKIPERAGFFIVDRGVVKIEVAPSVSITREGRPIRSSVIFSPDSASNATLQFGSLQWLIIQRDKMLGVRLRDLESETVKNFGSIDRYAVDAAWRVEATLEQGPEPEVISMVNILGQTIVEPSSGKLVFTIHETEYRLDALDGGKDLFIIFSDSTNGHDTYPAGRYLYASKPGEDGKTILDFNKAINPPCAFTPFATCLLPPEQNRMGIAVTAGEKKYLGYEHESKN